MSSFTWETTTTTYGLPPRERSRKAAGRPHKRREGCLPITKAKRLKTATRVTITLEEWMASAAAEGRKECAIGNHVWYPLSHPKCCARCGAKKGAV